jgi:beta-amylase
MQQQQQAMEEDGVKEEEEEYYLEEEDEGEEETRPPLQQQQQVGLGRRGRAREEKERTKLRERQRRAITARILAGLRRHGNYNLRVRADINEVIAALAREAGWVVLPDGTTFPSSSSSVSQPPPTQQQLQVWNRTNAAADVFLSVPLPPTLLFSLSALLCYV